MTRNHPQIELPPRVVTPNSKRALDLDRDYENNEDPRKRPALTKTGNESEYDESEESESDEDESKLNMNVEEIGFDEYISQGDKPFIVKSKNI